MAQCNMKAAWKARPEEPDQIAQQIRTLLALLRPITPEFARWYQVVAEDDLPELDEAATSLAGIIAAGVCRGDLGEPIPYLGYSSRTMNRPIGALLRRGTVCIDARIGSHMTNSVALIPGNPFDLPANLLAYPVVKQTILAFSHAFAPSWSCAGPASLWRGMIRSDYKEEPILGPCWMIHLSPPLAARITPPADVTSERFADGSLFLAVTEQTFDVQNAEHVAAAHRLFAVLDTLQEKLPPEQWRR